MCVCVGMSVCVWVWVWGYVYEGYGACGGMDVCVINRNLLSRFSF